MTEITIKIYADENGNEVIIPDDKLAKIITNIVSGKRLNPRYLNTLKKSCKNFIDICVNVESKTYKYDNNSGH